MEHPEIAQTMLRPNLSHNRQKAAVRHHLFQMAPDASESATDLPRSPSRKKVRGGCGPALADRPAAVRNEDSAVHELGFIIRKEQRDAC
jgi:hypothetical protein